MNVIKMENEQVETMKAWQLPSDPKRELLSSIGLFIGTGLLGFSGLGLEPL